MAIVTPFFSSSLNIRVCVDKAKEFVLIQYMTISFIFQVSECLGPVTKLSTLEEMKSSLSILSLQFICFCHSSELTREGLVPGLAHLTPTTNPVRISYMPDPDRQESGPLQGWTGGQSLQRV